MNSNDYNVDTKPLKSFSEQISEEILKNEMNIPSFYKEAKSYSILKFQEMGLTNKQINKLLF